MKRFATGVFYMLIAAGVAACTYPSVHPGVAITNRAMDALDNTAYNDYLKSAAEINLEREKAGLPPAPILTRDQWSGKK